MDDSFSHAFVALVELGGALGVSFSDGNPPTWSHTLGSWSWTMNGSKEPQGNPPIDPYDTLVAYDGFPVGFVGPFSGVLMTGAEDDFIAALEAETARLAGAPHE